MKQARRSDLEKMCEKRPTIVGVYAGAGGWKPGEAGAHLDPDTVHELRAQGFTMIRVRWRFSTWELIIRRYLEVAATKTRSPHHDPRPTSN